MTTRALNAAYRATRWLAAHDAPDFVTLPLLVCFAGFLVLMCGG